MTLVSFEGKRLSCMLDGDDLPWLSGNETAIALGYKRPHNAIGRYVMHDEKKKVMKGHTPQNRDYGQTYINESGLYRLIFSSKLPSAERFKTWVFTEVLPNLRKASLLGRQILFSETDLHYNVVRFIKLHYSDVRLIPGLGEYQHTKSRGLDAWSKRYVGGQPDIVIPLAVKEYNGLAIELKNPTGGGKVSPKQKEWHKYLSEESGYLVIVSRNYKEVTEAISHYLDKVRLSSQRCRKFYKSAKCLSNHNLICHLPL